MTRQHELAVASLMFHSVGLDRLDWAWASLSESQECFESKLRTFARHGYKTAFWREVYDHIADTRRLEPNSLMLTFDDGYLDNWVIVWPLLQRYGMKATIYCSPEFIEPDGPVRPTLQDVWEGRAKREELQVAGFLRPSEIRAMVRSGRVEVQSHAATHTWWFTGDRVIDVYTPDKYLRYPWMAWNRNPQRKPFYLSEDQSAFVPAGEPVFEHAKAMVARRFFPDAGAVEAFRAQWLASSQADPARPLAEAIARTVAQLGFSERWPGRYESLDERAARIEGELRSSRTVLEEITGEPVEFLCWPGGAYDDVACEIARKVGFRAWTLGSKDQSGTRNRPGGDPTLLKRISTQNRLFVRDEYCGTKDGWYQLLRVRAHQGPAWHGWLLAAYKFIVYAKAKLPS
jgi:peptidoglycan/xylan/chitin deacetylase (PgdA/CDA1 family)